MNPRAPLDPRLLEELSAYLDGRLDGAEKAALEERLVRDENLRRNLSELRTVRELLRALPPIKPPRALTLTRAQAGEPVRRFDWFSSRRMALGSALAAMAFVVVFGIDLFSRGSMPGAASPRVESFAAPAQLQSADKAALGSGEATAPPVAAQPQATGGLPSSTATGPREKTGAGENETPTGEPPPVEPQPESCGAPSIANRAVDKCATEAFLNEPPPQPFTLPDFQTLAPFLEGLLGLTALLLAVFAIIARRRR